MNAITEAAATLVNAVKTTYPAIESMPTEDAIVAAAAFAAGLSEQDSDVTLALDYDTEWLQDAYEAGRRA